MSDDSASEAAAWDCEPSDKPSRAAKRASQRRTPACLASVRVGEGLKVSGVGVREGRRGSRKICAEPKEMRRARVFCEAKQWTRRSRQASGSRAGGGGEWGWKGRMEGATGRELCPE